MSVTSVQDTTLRAEVESRGFAVIEDVVPADVTQRLKAAISRLGEREEVRRKAGIYGIRNLLDVLPEACELAVSDELRSVVEPILGADAFAVRGTLFDKIPSANWKLGWHQDNVITVRQPIEVSGFGSFSQKAGVWYVEPTLSVLEGVLAVRVHLDDCDKQNGPLRVLPGSHRSGWIEEDLPQWKHDVEPVVCEVAAGGVVLLRPLLLHASSSADVPRHRRVLHLEYAASPLPNGLEWHTQLRP